MITVLVVERDPAVARLYSEELEDAGFSVRVRPGLASAMADLRQKPVQILVTDQSSMNGELDWWLATARRVHAGPVVVLGLDRRNPEDETRNLSSLPKTSDLNPLIQTLRRHSVALLWSSAASQAN